MTRFPATRLESVTRTFVVAQGAGSAARALDARRTLARSGPGVSAKHAGTHRRIRASLTPRVGENELSPPVRPVPPSTSWEGAVCSRADAETPRRAVSPAPPGSSLLVKERGTPAAGPAAPDQPRTTDRAADRQRLHRTAGRPISHDHQRFRHEVPGPAVADTHKEGEQALFLLRAAGDMLQLTSSSVEYQCLPDTVDPRGPKGK